MESIDRPSPPGDRVRRSWRLLSFVCPGSQLSDPAGARFDQHISCEPRYSSAGSERGVSELSTRVDGLRVALWVAICAVALLMGTPHIVHAQQAAQGSIVGTVIDSETGEPLNYSNVVILGSTMGGNAINGGQFAIERIPVGVYQVQASYVGYDPQTIVDVTVDADEATSLVFKLKKGVAGQVKTIKVTGDAKKIDVKSSNVSHVTTDDQILTLPVESVEEAVALNTGVVVQGGELHVRGGRSGEISVRIDGVPVDDPLSGGTVDLGLLSVAQSELITGGI